MARRYQVVRHRTRLKNEVHAILHAHLIPRCPHSDLFNGPGRRWLAAQPLPSDEVAAVERHVRELDQLGEDLKRMDKEIAIEALDDPAVARLMTITGVNLTVATGLIAQSAMCIACHAAEAGQLLRAEPACAAIRARRRHHGRISKAGRSHARAMLVEAWAAAKTPGPLHAFFVRVRTKRGHQIAAVALAPKLTVLCWHLLTKETDYLWARPALVSARRRTMELQAGKPQKKGNKRGPAYAYNVKALRDQKMKVAEQAEKFYEHFVGQWRARPPRGEGAQTPQTSRT